MRVIAGTAKGRKLASPRGSRVRPTSDRVKEALFSILSVMIGDFSGCSVLDIFAGTGNLGIEALSRGAGHAVFIDSSRTSVEIIRKNLALTGFADKGTVVCRDALDALKSLRDPAAPFRLVFLDPPYYEGLLDDVLDFLSKSSLLDDHSLVVAELSSREEPRQRHGMLQVIDRRIYGDTALIFLTPSDRGNP